MIDWLIRAYLLGTALFAFAIVFAVVGCTAFEGMEDIYRRLPCTGRVLMFVLWPVSIVAGLANSVRLWLRSREDVR